MTLADYYGFFHYRRYLYPDVTAKLPYRIEGAPTVELLDKLDYGCFPELISQYNLILPKGENMHIPVRKHYDRALFHHSKDLELVEGIIRETYPEYAGAMEAYLSGTSCYFGNIFIMGRAVFEDYCQWLFPLLTEFDRRADTKGYGSQEQRVDGYLAERLLGAYAIHHQGLKTLELPRVHFVGNSLERVKQKALSLALPPGSVRRSWIKSLKG